MFAYCVAVAYQEAAFRGASQAPRCASRRAPKGAVEERIHRLGDGVRIGLFARQQQAAANERLDFTIAKLEPIAAKAVAAALPAAAHPLSGAGAGDLGVCDNRGGDALVHRTTLLIPYSTAAGVEIKPWRDPRSASGRTVVGRPPVLNAAELAPLEVAPLLEGRRPTPRRSLGTGRQSRAAHRLKLRSRRREGRLPPATLCRRPFGPLPGPVKGRPKLQHL